MDQIIEIHGELYVCFITTLSPDFAPESDGDLVCQSGARWEDINRILKENGIPLFFPVGTFILSLCSAHANACFIPYFKLDPGPGAVSRQSTLMHLPRPLVTRNGQTIGGMIGTGCSGSEACDDLSLASLTNTCQRTPSGMELPVQNGFSMSYVPP